MLTVIAFIGKARSGKDTCARIFKEELNSKGLGYNQGLGLDVEILALADELREHMEVLNPIVGELKETGATFSWNLVIRQFGYEEAKNKFPEMRRIMQTYGTDIIREKVNQRYWVDCTIEKICSMNRDYRDKVVLISDMRFANEYEAMRSFFAGKGTGISWFLGIRVTRPELDDNQSNHQSENLNWVHGYECLTITNDGDMEKLKKTCGQVVGECLEIMNLRSGGNY